MEAQKRLNPAMARPVPPPSPAGRTRRRALLLAAAAGLALLLPRSPLAGAGWLSPVQAQSRDGVELRIGAIPDQKPEKLNRLYGEVARELERQLKVPVRYVPVVDYSAAVSAFRTGSLDLVWFGGLTGVQARLQRPGAKLIAQRDIDARFRTVFIASSRSGLKPFNSLQGLQSLRGRRFTFGSESSTSGRLMPQFFLGKAGVKPADFAGGAPGFSGSHDATIALVQSGAYEAGAVNQQVWTSSLIEGKANPARVIALWRTPPYPDYQWVAQPNLDQRFGKGFTGRLQNAIVGWRVQDPQQKRILGLFGAQRFVKGDARAYAQIEEVGRQLGMIR
jgi:phosphonate transport system substrate-binding protein